MTSATTLLGVMPLALEFGLDYEIWPAFAITVLGGLSLSMVSTLVLIPVVYMGLDQVVRWLRDVGALGVCLGSVAASAALYGVHQRYESTFWTCLVALPFWFGFLGLVWMGLQVHRARQVWPGVGSTPATPGAGFAGLQGISVVEAAAFRPAGLLCLLP